MTIRRDLDMAYAQLRSSTGRPIAAGPRWRMCPGTHAALTACLDAKERPPTYLGMPIEVAADIKGWELVRT